MSSRRIKILYGIIGALSIIGSIYFYLQTSPDTDVSLRSDEGLFVEMPGPATSSPIKELTATSSPMKIPILVYHIVRPAYPTDSKGVRALAQTPEVFDAQMQYLKEAGYHVIPFRLFEDHLLRNTPVPSNPVVLTFDDGWSNQFR